MTIHGWAFGLIDARLNPAGVDRPRLRIDEAVVRFDDRVRVRDTPTVHASSVIRDDAELVVWITDRSAYGDGSTGFLVEYMARGRTFGGMQHCDTLDEALDAYDRIRGVQAEQLALFGGVA